MWFLLFISFLILLRLLELLVARRNEKWILSKGGIEYGASHYPWMVALHTVFIFSLIVEYLIRGPVAPNYFLLFFYIVTILLKIAVISSLGKYWNTKIYRVPGSTPIKQGAYKYIRHPNYIIVVIEIAIIPLIFQLYFTAIIFTILNAIMLKVRIREEENAWR